MSMLWVFYIVCYVDNTPTRMKDWCICVSLPMFSDVHRCRFNSEVHRYLYLFFLSLSHKSLWREAARQSPEQGKHLACCPRRHKRSWTPDHSPLNIPPPPPCPQRVLSSDVITWPARQTLTTADLLHDNLLVLAANDCVCEWVTE